MTPDPQDMFRQSCISAQDYPENLINIDRCRRSYATDVEEWREEYDRLWDADGAVLELLELYAGDDGLYFSLSTRGCKLSI
jgi:hypothetical protein